MAVFKRAAAGQIAEIELPAPRERGPLSLEEAPWQRRSVRHFAETPVGHEALAQILWAAQGSTDPPDHRTAPSAGALYPLRLYVAGRDAVFAYLPERHSLMPVKAGDVRCELYHSALLQEAILEAPVTLVIAASYRKTAAKYGLERATRYVDIEAGHVAQNILLQAVVEGLGCVPIGAFSDARVNEALGLPPGEMALYLLPLGTPA